MSTRKERRMKTAIDPLIKQVKDYVSHNEDQLAALGIIGKVKFHANVKTDKLNKQAQIIFTLVQGKMSRKVAPQENKKVEEVEDLGNGPTPAQNVVA